MRHAGWGVPSAVGSRVGAGGGFLLLEKAPERSRGWPGPQPTGGSLRGKGAHQAQGTAEPTACRRTRGVLWLE